MTKFEASILMQEIKKFYPKFDIAQPTVDAWFERLQYVTYNNARMSFNEYLDNDTSNRAPAIGVLMGRKGGTEIRTTMTLDAARKTVIWKPEADGKTYEIPVRYDAKADWWEDEDGRIYSLPV